MKVISSLESILFVCIYPGVTGLRMIWELNLVPLKHQSVFLTAEPPPALESILLETKKPILHRQL